MKMTMALRESILALMEEYIRLCGAKGHQMSASQAARMACGNGNLPGDLLKWDGGKKGPTLHSCVKLEGWLADQVDSLEPGFYDRFMKRRAAMVSGDDGF